MSTYNPGKIKSMARIIAHLVAENPILAHPNNEDYLMATLAANIPALKDKEHCPNCHASMAEYEDVLDVNDVLLVHSMARIVNQNLEAGMTFTEANKVRVSAETFISHVQKCRTTKCSKLGLIAKAGNAHWAITRRGFEALAGKQIPRSRVTFRGEIIDRPEELTTFGAIVAEHRIKMADLEERGKSTRFDYRAAASTYDPKEWYVIAGFHEGEIM